MSSSSSETGPGGARDPIGPAGEGGGDAGRVCPPPEARIGVVLELFERYYDRVYIFARRSSDASTAEDIAQEVFARLLDCEGLERKSLSVSYLIKVADNLLKRRYRRAKRQEAYVKGVAGDRGRHDRTTTHADAAERPRRADDQLDSIGDGLRVLGEDEHHAVRMIVCEGKSYREAAEALGARVTTVNNWKYRGIQRLKRHTAEREHAAPGRRADGRADGRDERRGRHGDGDRLGKRAG